MFKNIKFRAAVATLVFLAALFYLIPTLLPNLPDFWEEKLPKDKIHLGLDLQGGMHLVLEVDADKAVEATLERLANNFKETLMDNKIRFRKMDRDSGKTITLELTDPGQRDAFDKILKNHYPDLSSTRSETIEGREKLYLEMNKKRMDEIKKMAVEQSLETIRNRVDQFGISEPEIIPQGDDRILIQLPGIADTRRAKNLIGKTALLEFKLVDDEHSLEEALRGNIPEGTEIVYGSHVDRETGRQTSSPYLLKSKTLLTGDSLESAKVQIGDRLGKPHVSIRFNSQGANDFERITGENVKKQLAIVLDGNVYSAPVIQERISGGQAQISGAFTMDEARDLAIVLRAGALPAPVTILEERTIGPSLGQDSINKGIWSCIVGGILVAIFMAIYYRFSGIIADIALGINLVRLLGIMVIFGATLMLPGISGIVLTIWMAVDANVLICERIREELRSGKTARASVEAGYAKAFLTIFDANITTLIAALFLFGFGTGPVKGFAVTLTIGIVVSMYTAVFVTRIIYDYLIWNRKMTRLSI
ncbi:MAG: protein translocase subunit SecD [Deltaproteobacteria bacterium]|nr:protein translocase subunit SecD [Deltaproteobacteria bacterium]